MDWEIVFSPQSLEDLAEAVRYIANDNQDAAERIGNALIDRVLVLREISETRASLSKARRCSDVEFQILNYFLSDSRRAKQG